MAEIGIDWGCLDVQCEVACETTAQSQTPPEPLALRTAGAWLPPSRPGYLAPLAELKLATVWPAAPMLLRYLVRPPFDRWRFSGMTNVHHMPSPLAPISA